MKEMPFGCEVKERERMREWEGIGQILKNYCPGYLDNEFDVVYTEAWTVGYIPVKQDTLLGFTAIGRYFVERRGTARGAGDSWGDLGRLGESLGRVGMADAAVRKR